MNEKRLYEVILSTHTTEKTSNLAEKYRHVTFKVLKDATKHEIKQAIEKLFNVVVSKVRVCNVLGKSKKFKNRQGKRANWKKATVVLAEGNDINVAEFE